MMMKKHNPPRLMDFHRGAAVVQYCQNCKGLDIMEDDTTQLINCPEKHCPLHLYRTGQSLIRLNSTIEDRSKAIRWACLYCVGKDGRPGKTVDVWSCTNKACSLWPYRKGNQCFEPEHVVAVSKSGFPKLVYQEPQTEVPEEPITEEPIQEETPEPMPSLDEYLATFEPVFKDIDCGVHEKYVTR